MPKGSPTEKRAAQRVPVSLTAHCRIGHRFVREPVADLSLGGLYLKTREQVVKKGIPVRVALALPYSDGPRFCTLAGQVVRIDRDAKGKLVGMGVSFAGEEIAAVDRSTLETYLMAKSA
jgi:Tfp pilus assembly protein PilZ